MMSIHTDLLCSTNKGTRLPLVYLKLIEETEIDIVWPLLLSLAEGQDKRDTLDILATVIGSTGSRS